MKALKHLQDICVTRKQEMGLDVDEFIKGLFAQAIKEFEELEGIVEEEKCTWKINYKNDMYIGETWDTNCGNVFQFMEGGIEENNFKHCPYCGKTIQEQSR
jgi:PHP family Zn ribbon phosphoesterase